MDEIISAGEANRRFSSLLRGVREGHSYTVTSHGRPVARLVPINEERDAQARARKALLKRLSQQPALNAGKWTREELYERDE